MAAAQTPPRLPAHPLVVGLTAASEMKASALGASYAAQESADVKDAIKEAWGNTAPGHEADRKTLEKARGTAALDTFSGGVGSPHYRLVAGYLGGCIAETPGKAPDRQILYLDTRLTTWLQVLLSDVALFNRVKDSSAAFGLRDILWLQPDARVVRGDDSDSVQQSYLSGPFIRVADIETSLGGGGMTSRSSGLVCEALTPGCCTSHTQRQRP